MHVEPRTRGIQIRECMQSDGIEVEKESKIPEGTDGEVEAPQEVGEED